MPIKLPLYRFGSFIELLRELGFRVGAEIGVCKGMFSRYLLKKIPGLKLYGIDPWLVYGEYTEHHRESEQSIMDSCLEVAKSRVAPYDCELIRATSMEAVGRFEDGSLDFVFIDGNHSFRYVIDDIAEWSKKVRPGGIVAGHDFWTSADRPDEQLYIDNLTPREKINLVQVEDAVIGWTRANQIKPWFITKKDASPSWFWVKTQ